MPKFVLRMLSALALVLGLVVVPNASAAHASSWGCTPEAKQCGAISVAEDSDLPVAITSSWPTWLGSKLPGGTNEVHATRRVVPDGTLNGWPERVGGFRTTTACDTYRRLPATAEKVERWQKLERWTWYQVDANEHVVVTVWC